MPTPESGEQVSPTQSTGTESEGVEEDQNFTKRENGQWRSQDIRLDIIHRLLLLLLSHVSRVRLLATPWTAAHQAPPSMGFSRQEYWSGVPLPSPNTEARYRYNDIDIYRYNDRRLSVQFSQSVTSDSLQPHELQHARPPCQRRQWHPTPVLLPGKSHGWKSR